MASADRRRAASSHRHLAVPHLGLPLLLSALTIALGVGRLSLAGRARRRPIAALLDAIGWGPDRGFDQAMRGLLRLSFARDAASSRAAGSTST